MTAEWLDLGAVEELRRPARRIVDVAGKRVALTYIAGRFGAVSDVCNHAGGLLGEGELDGEYLTCPWHYWKFHFATGEGEPGFEADLTRSSACRLSRSLKPRPRRPRKAFSSASLPAAEGELP